MRRLDFIGTTYNFGKDPTFSYTPSGSIVWDKKIPNAYLIVDSIYSLLDCVFDSNFLSGANGGTYPKLYVIRLLILVSISIGNPPSWKLWDMDGNLSFKKSASVHLTGQITSPGFCHLNFLWKTHFKKSFHPKKGHFFKELLGKTIWHQKFVQFCPTFSSC